MARMTITVCDKCRNVAAPTQPVSIKTKAGTTKLDLCPEHAKPLVELAALKGA